MKAYHRRKRVKKEKKLVIMENKEWNNRHRAHLSSRREEKGAEKYVALLIENSWKKENDILMKI